MDKSLTAEALDGYIAGFRKGLTVGDIRGKILVMSRDTYDNGPHGAYITGWSHSDLYQDQTKAVITGADGSEERALVQDFYDCTGDDGIDRKIDAMLHMLDIRMAAKSTRWCVNHASGYTKGSSSDGYRDNAARTSKALLDVLNSPDTEQGATGIIMMDYAGTDKSGEYDVRGLELTKAIIAQNSRYTPLTTAISDNTQAHKGVSVSRNTISSDSPMAVYRTDGTMVTCGVTEAEMPSDGIFIVRVRERTSRYWWNEPSQGRRVPSRCPELTGIIKSLICHICLCHHPVRRSEPHAKVSPVVHSATLHLPNLTCSS